MRYRKSEQLVVGVTLWFVAAILLSFLDVAVMPVRDALGVASHPIIVGAAGAFISIVIGGVAAWWKDRKSEDRRRNTVQLFLAAESDPMRRAIRELVEKSPAIRVTGEARSCSELLLLLRDAKLKPHVVLMDLDMPGESRFVTESFKSHLGDSRLLVMSLWDDPAAANLAKSYGAVKLVDKNDLGSNLVPAIQECSHLN